MPINSKGREIMANMKRQYGSDKKAKQVFFASKNKGKITGVEGESNKKHIAMAARAANKS
jgi:hypothetical protein